MKLILAPMAALTHSGLRRLIKTFGEPCEYFSEMIHAPSALSGGGFEKWYFKASPSPKKLVWQVTSPQAEAAAAVCPILLKSGGIGIDLNMGCCAPQITSTGAGAAWMKKPYAETANLVRLVKKAILEYEKFDGKPQKKPVRLSVKLRLGETEDYSSLLKFCTMLIGEGVELITLHPRTIKQKYSRQCKHEYTARLAEDLSVPVYGNGDIDSFEAAKKISTQCECSGLMIGRFAVQKPWLFYEISSKEDKRFEPLYIDLLKTAENFISFLKEDQPQEFHLTRAQRFFGFYCNNFKFSHYIKTKILNSKSLCAMLEHLQEYLNAESSDRMLLLK